MKSCLIREIENEVRATHGRLAGEHNRDGAPNHTEAGSLVTRARGTLLDALALLHLAAELEAVEQRTGRRKRDPKDEVGPMPCQPGERRQLYAWLIFGGLLVLLAVSAAVHGELVEELPACEWTGIGCEVLEESAPPGACVAVLSCPELVADSLPPSCSPPCPDAGQPLLARVGDRYLPGEAEAGELRVVLETCGRLRTRRGR